MYLCYVDESGTSDVPGNTSHFILAGLCIPIDQWKRCDADIDTIKAKYALRDQEVHIAWLLRAYLEQSRIAGFAALTYQQRRTEVQMLRRAELLRLQSRNLSKQYRQVRKNYRETEAYIHLTVDERRALASELAACIAGWPFARLFAECIDKVYFDPVITGRSIPEQSLEQLVSRFQLYLKSVATGTSATFGMLIHDNNATVARRHTDLMKTYHRSGTLWTDIDNIAETPLFVDSQLTGMVQVADLCAYSLRRYLENNETVLFDQIFKVTDRRGGVAVGVRHYARQPCPCRICAEHRSGQPNKSLELTP